MLYKDCENLSGVQSNDALIYCINLIGPEDLKKLLELNLERTVTQLIRHLTDEMYISKHLKNDIIFASKGLSTMQIRNCLNYLEVVYYI